MTPGMQHLTKGLPIPTDENAEEQLSYDAVQIYLWFGTSGTFRDGEVDLAAANAAAR